MNGAKLVNMVKWIFFSVFRYN